MKHSYSKRSNPIEMQMTLANVFDVELCSTAAIVGFGRALVVVSGWGITSDLVSGLVSGLESGLDSGLVSSFVTGVVSGKVAGVVSGLISGFVSGSVCFLTGECSL